MSTHTVQVDVAGVTKLLATNLYSDPDVFLRELIQNGHDAVLKREVLAPEGNGHASRPRIWITTNEADATLTVEDNGAGLTEAEIHSYLATIGASDKPALRRQIASRSLDGTRELIGQFGIGLLSAFIVADRIEIVTRSQSEHGWRWTSTGGRDYALEPAERDAVGSTVILHLSPQQRRYLRYDKLREIIKKYSDFVGVPIYLGDGGGEVNAVNAPWHRNYASEEERRVAHRVYWEARFQKETSLAIFPLNEHFEVVDPVTDERGAAQVQGILGITDRHIPGVNTRGTIDIYVKRVFVASANRDALPPWAGFIQGVIECGQLTPNAARDSVVVNNVVFALRNCLGQFIVRRLGELAANDVNRFKDIMAWHQFQVLGMCTQDENDDFFRAVADIVPLESDQGQISVKEYVSTARPLPDGRRVVYYISESSSESQFYMLCQARGLRVFNAVGGFTRSFLERYQRTWPDRIKLSRIDVATSETIFEPVPPEERKPFEPLELYATTLKCTAKVSRFLPREVPALLSKSRQDDAREDMEAMAEAANLPDYIRNTIKGYLAESREQLTLHLNADNAIVRLLAQRLARGDELAKNSLISIYNNAVMLNSRNITPENIRTMFNQYNQVIGEMLTNAERIEELERTRHALEVQIAEMIGGGGQPGTDSQLDPWVTCFVAMPFDKPEIDEVYEALESVLEDTPFLWNVIRADKSVRDARLWKNVDRQMAGAHCFIAEVSEHNPNVMIEIGRMEAFERPILLLKKKGSPDLPADLRERLYAEYSGTGEDLVTSLRDEIKAHEEHFGQQEGEAYLSKTFLRSESGLSKQVCDLIADRYRSCTGFLNANPVDVARSLNRGQSLVVAAQEAVRTALERLGRVEPR